MQTTKARYEAAFLVFVVFLLGALLGGLGNHMWGETVWGQQRVAPKGPPPRDAVINNFTRELQLTSDQQTQLGAILDDTRTKWESVSVPADAEKERIRQESHARIRAILTPDQQPKFDVFMQRLDEQRKRNRGH
jgi:Spy/CpxP family protein refolding chaperone